MDNYFIDRETLSELVDGLIKKKPLAVDNTEELDKIREEAIASLDDKIVAALFGNLTEEQDTELNRLLDSDASEDEYQEFFDKIGLDMEKIITNTMEQFAQEFLGGQNG